MGVHPLPNKSCNEHPPAPAEPETGPTPDRLSVFVLNVSNAVLFDHGARSEDDEWVNSFENVFDKKFEVSFLSGAKKLTDGHRFRQEIHKLEDQITIPKKWFYTLEDFNQENFNKGGIGRPDKIWGAKQKCFTESMFNIGVENVNHNNWYTEKIADSFATKTIPIYWGCSNIDDFYNDKGITEAATQGIKLPLDSVLYIPSGNIDQNSGMMLSYLHKSIKIVNQLKIRYKVV